MDWNLHLKGPKEAIVIFGERDSNLKTLKKVLNIKVIARDNRLRLSGEDSAVERARDALNEILAQMRAGIVTTPAESSDMLNRLLKRGVEPIREAGDLKLEDFLLTPLKSEGQRVYVQKMLENPIVFCIGPSGTGKTYLAVMMAVALLRYGLVNKIVLVRPAVEAGEKLGFLPGDFEEKVSPYLKPLYDALYDFLSVNELKEYRETEIIEVIPLAYMRGRTLNRSLIILDEAQNTTSTQMKMFLTRMGVASKVVVTGDVTQIDLRNSEESGLVQAQRILSGIEGVAFVYMGKNDIVRNPIIQQILDAYERAEEKNGSEKS
ncbi:MAG: PhoH family protein [Planctomycetota bacterium]|nr:PhoH family protein [Planctomycetota bacterium]